MENQSLTDIAAIQDQAEREKAIRLRMFEVFDDVCAMAVSFNRDALAFVEQYKTMRRAQAAYFKARKSGAPAEEIQRLLVESKQLEADLDKFAARLSPKQEQP